MARCMETAGNPVQHMGFNYHLNNRGPYGLNYLKHLDLGQIRAPRPQIKGLSAKEYITPPPTVQLN